MMQFLIPMETNRELFLVCGIDAAFPVVNIDVAGDQSDHQSRQGDHAHDRDHYPTIWTN